MNYKEAVSYLNSFSRFGSRPGLTTIQYLLYLMGNPERRLRVIHIAGTNGKGSTSSMLAKGLANIGYKVGLYTSPHLFSIRERIKINGIDITEEEFTALVEEVIPYVERVSRKNGCFHPTFFETLTAMAFWYFAEKKVDISIVETGMGGRFDATNVTYPLISLITHIARDHTNFLGWEIEKIAEEKCGIIKGGIPVVSGIQSENVKKVIENFSSYKGSPFYILNNKVSHISLTENGTDFVYKDEEGINYNVSIPLIGYHQAENAALSIYASEVLKKHWDYDFSISQFIKGLRGVKWPGRFQIASKRPYIILDGAHNLDGTKRLVETLKSLFPNKKITIISGILKDKEYKEMAKLLAPLAKKIIVTTPESERALSPSVLKEVFSLYTDVPIEVILNPIEALKYAKKDLSPHDILLVTGSLYLIGKVGSLLLKNEKK